MCLLIARVQLKRHGHRIQRLFSHLPAHRSRLQLPAGCINSFSKYKLPVSEFRRRALAINAGTNLALSFCGCGFLTVYHIGVASALRPVLCRIQRYSGASGGTLVACVLAVRGADPAALQAMVTFAHDLANDVRSQRFGVMTPQFTLLGPLREILDDLLPENAHETASGRLHVSITCRQTRTNEIVSSFSSRSVLIQCILASCYIPHVTGTHGDIVINGKSYIDGGLTNNLPTFTDMRTVTVSPLSGDQDICPDDDDSRWHVIACNQHFRLSRINALRAVHTLAPPSDRLLNDYFQNGVSDAERFLASQ